MMSTTVNMASTTGFGGSWMADARATVAEQRAAEAHIQARDLRAQSDAAGQENARLRAELDAAQEQLASTAPDHDDVPF
jgi:hypothetical protein